MKIFHLTWLLLSAGSLRGEDAIRILTADPADNVLLEISTDTPRSVMASSDLKTWSYVFHYVPACQGFKAYAAQLQRKQTYYKLAPVHPTLASVALLPEVPTLAGKSFANLASTHSFSANGVGTCRTPAFESGEPENLSYSIVDSRPGMISVRTVVADGYRRDHLILMAVPSTLPASPGHALVYTADRYGDFFSYGWWTDEFPPDFLVHSLGSEVPVAQVTWPTPEGMVVRFVQSGEVVTLGEDGIATILKSGISETATYEYFATGALRATLRLLRSDGTRTTASIRALDVGPVYHRAPGTEPYSFGGFFPDFVTLVSYPASAQ